MPFKGIVPWMSHADMGEFLLPTPQIFSSSSKTELDTVYIILDIAWMLKKVLAGKGKKIRKQLTFLHHRHLF